MFAIYYDDMVYSPFPPLSTCGPWGHSCLYSRVSIVGQGSQGCPQPIPTCSMVSTVQQQVDLVTNVLDGFKHCPSLMLVKHSPLLESTISLLVIVKPITKNIECASLAVSVRGFIVRGHQNLEITNCKRAVWHPAFVRILANFSLFHSSFKIFIVSTISVFQLVSCASSVTYYTAV